MSCKTMRTVVWNELQNDEDNGLLVTNQQRRRVTNQQRRGTEIFL